MRGSRKAIYQWNDENRGNVIIQMDAHVLDGETIEVGVNFSEHAWRSGIEMNDSIYFDFE